MIARSSTALVAAGLLALAGCAKGPIRGQLALPNQTPQAASLNYESGLFGKTGKLSTTLPTGESFTGPYGSTPPRRTRRSPARWRETEGTTWCAGSPSPSLASAPMAAGP